MWSKLHWDSWGGPTAEGTGDALYVPGIGADGKNERARVIAYDLGNCRGVLAYRSLEWYFPAHKERFDPRNGQKICFPT